MDEAWKKYFDPQVLERLRGLRLRFRRSGDGRFVGSHRSPRRGQAVEFSEYRQYTAGDDLRQLDWKVLARTDKVYLRQREDEATLDCHLMIDASGSMGFRSVQAPSDKLTYGLRLAASLAFVAVENHDTASLTSVGASVAHLLPAGSGPGHLLAMAEAMQRIEAGEDMEVAERWTMAAQSLIRGGLVVVISDLFDDPQQWIKTIGAIRSGGRSLIVAQIVDPAELAFPFGDRVQFVGLEGEPPLVADTRGIAAAYREDFARHRRQIEEACRDSGAEFWALCTDQPLRARLPELLASLNA